MTFNGQHPENLLWFVAGEVESPERARVLRHLASCEDCRDETAALASMMKSIVAQTHLDHITTEDLVLFEEETTRGDSDKARQIREHLEDCGACRDEMETIALARRREADAAWPVARSTPRVERTFPALRVVGHDIPAIPGRRPDRRWAIAAAAGIVVAIALGIVGLPPSATAPAGPLAAKLVVLGAPQRGTSAAGLFEGSGPWAVRVLLPYGIGPTSFKVTIRLERQETLPRFDTIATSDNEGCLDVIVPDLPSTGRYELVLQPLTGEDTQERVYPFEHVASAPDPRAG